MSLKDLAAAAIDNAGESVSLVQIRLKKGATMRNRHSQTWLNVGGVLAREIMEGSTPSVHRLERLMNLAQGLRVAGWLSQSHNP